ncbi:YppF family protein [Oceanobacillus manasiensis]|uniref:YppF family protein n=1 Tax=Oceanobacillus manasiensis TaxID=586413 RepID=UPI0005A9BDE3|nr:YppF family protein [Oceanobacillus manasiensis]
MQLHTLVARYEIDRSHAPDSIHALLDYYQTKYISQEIDLVVYREIFRCLDKEGAVSSHDQFCKV